MFNYRVWFNKKYIAIGSFLLGFCVIVIGITSLGTTHTGEVVGKTFIPAHEEYVKNSNNIWLPHHVDDIYIISIEKCPGYVKLYCRTGDFQVDEYTYNHTYYQQEVSYYIPFSWWGVFIDAMLIFIALTCLFFAGCFIDWITTENDKLGIFMMSIFGIFLLLVAGGALFWLVRSL